MGVAFTLREETRQNFIRSNRHIILQHWFNLSRAIPRKGALDRIPPPGDQVLSLGSIHARLKSCTARPGGGNGRKIGNHANCESGQKGCALRRPLEA